MIATSGRAIAQSLSSLGCSVAVVDGFADCDTRAAATEVLKSKRSQFGLDQDSVLHAVQNLKSKHSFDGLFFDAAMESNPTLLDEINVHPIIGNSSHTINVVKNSKEFFTTLDQCSIVYPETTFNLPSNPIPDSSWLLKHAQGSGGIGVAPFNTDVEMPDSIYFQKKLDGINFSITFLANGSDMYVLGFNTLWSEALGVSVPYAYAGAINHVKIDDQAQETALNYARVLIKEYKLVGLNSIDFICSNGTVYVLEINPRIPSTYELYESKDGGLMNDHIAACLQQVLPKTRSKPLLRAHAIVYAPTEIIVPETMSWPLWVADRPESQDVIKKYDPLCSVFAGGKNYAQTNEMIKTRKRFILGKVLPKVVH